MNRLKYRVSEIIPRDVGIYLERSSSTSSCEASLYENRASEAEGLISDDEDAISRDA